MKFTILESVFDATKDGIFTHYVYLNPTKQELNSREDSKSNRGIIDSKTGDLYMESVWVNDNTPKHSNWIHHHLIDFLKEQGKFLKVKESWWTNPRFLDYCLCVHRDGSSLNFYISESYRKGLINNNLQQVEEIFDIAKKKNPHLNFDTTDIYTHSGGRWL